MGRRGNAYVDGLRKEYQENADKLRARIEHADSPKNRESMQAELRELEAELNRRITDAESSLF